jgi:hypothetical protein
MHKIVLKLQGFQIGAYLFSSLSGCWVVSNGDKIQDAKHI